jgi:hypothetical protein
MTQAQLFMINAAERHALAQRNQSTGEIRKQRGQLRVLEKAGLPWIDRALFLFGVYVKGLGPGSRFAVEDVRAFMFECGLQPPHDHHAWGPLPCQAVAKGIAIRRTDQTRKAISPRTHAHRVTLWECT